MTFLSAECPMSARDGTGAEALRRIVCSAKEIELPDPEPLVAPGEEERCYPVDVLPTILSDAIEEYQRYGQQPISLVACSAMAASSLAVQGLANVARDEALSGPINLFFLVVAHSGERKTSADRVFAELPRTWMIEEQEARCHDIQSARAALAAWEAEREGLLAKIKSAGGRQSGDGQVKIENLRQKLASLEAEKPPRPILPSLFFEDLTPEALAVEIAEGWPSTSLWSDEGGLTVGSHGMSDESLMRFLALLNRLWDGNPFERRRHTTKNALIKGRRLTTYLMMQPIVFMRLLGANGGASRAMGFIARCLITWPRSTIGSRSYRPPPSGMPAVARLHRRFRVLLDMPLPVTGSDMTLAPPLLKLSPAAFSLWRKFHDDVEASLSQSGEYGNIPDIGAKVAENATRIAAVFHILENGPAGDIDERTMSAAVSVAVWHLTEARRVIGAVDKPQAVADAELLLDWLRRQVDQPIKPRRILSAGPPALRDRTRRDTALKLLIETRHVEEPATKAIVLNRKARFVA
jgi:hypothetical protein